MHSMEKNENCQQIGNETQLAEISKINYNNNNDTFY